MPGPHEDWHPPIRDVIARVWAANPQRERLDALWHERDEAGNRKWFQVIEDDPDDATWSRLMLRPSDKRDTRPAMRVGRWPPTTSLTTTSPRKRSSPSTTPTEEHAYVQAFRCRQSRKCAGIARFSVCAAGRSRRRSDARQRGHVVGGGKNPSRFPQCGHFSFRENDCKSVRAVTSVRHHFQSLASTAMAGQCVRVGPQGAVPVRGLDRDGTAEPAAGHLCRGRDPICSASRFNRCQVGFGTGCRPPRPCLTGTLVPRPSTQIWTNAAAGSAWPSSSTAQARIP